MNKQMDVSTAYAKGFKVGWDKAEQKVQEAIEEEKSQYTYKPIYKVTDKSYYISLPADVVLDNLLKELNLEAKVTPTPKPKK